MQAGQDVNVGGRLTKTQYQFTLTDTNSEELNHWAPIVEKAMEKLPELQDVASDQQEIAAPHLAVDVDRDMRYRVSGCRSPRISIRRFTTPSASVQDGDDLRLGQPVQGHSRSPAEVPEPERHGAPDRIYVIRGPTGGAQVPLSAVAHFTPKVEPLSVNHEGQFPAVTLSFNLTPGVALGQAVEKIQALEATLKTPATLDGAFQGTAQAFQSSLSSTPFLVAAAIFAVYVVLGMLYESFIHPLTILSALPSAGVGALLMLLLFGYDLSIIALIGIILLIGIVKKNAIMMIDFALEAERKEGKSPLEAIHQACLLRFRPIMMTTMAALFGGLPLALGQGAGAELRQPLGIAIVGGLLVSQWLTLYTTPVIYLYLDRLGRWLGSSKRQAPKKPRPVLTVVHAEPVERGRT